MPTAKDDLAAKLVDLERRATELEAQLAAIKQGPAPFKPAPPHQPIDYTARASMDKETMRDLASAISPDLARDLRADLARGNPINQSVAQLTPDRGGAVERGSGYRDAVPFGPQPGINYVDEQCAEQDRQDRADLERRLARTAKEKG